MGERLGTIASGGGPALHLLKLDASFADALGAEICVLEGAVAPAVLASSDLFTNVLRCFAGATHAIVELDYFDADFRSTAALTLSRRHDPIPLTTDRVLFLSVRGKRPPKAPTAANLLDWLDTFRTDLPTEPTRIGNRVLGYVILNGDPGGMIGRSLLPPPPKLNRVKATVPVAQRVRTAVTEIVALGGRLFAVSGVPFMHQDGNILTCAHVSAWMVHYNAVLRGLARRHHTADFHRLPGSHLVTSRSIPSSGLTEWQVSTLLEELGLPAEVLDKTATLRQARHAEWYDRQAIWDMCAQLEKVAGMQPPANKTSFEQHDFLITKLQRQIEQLQADLAELEAERAVGNADDVREAAVKVELGKKEAFLEHIDSFWVRENLTTAVCQHLNSGFPALVVQPPHAWVINGYLRNRDLVSVDKAMASETGTGAFIAADDQRGPYLVNNIERLAEAVYGGLSTVLLPLPPGVWLRGHDAEQFGARLFREALVRLIDSRALLGDETDEPNPQGPRLVSHPQSLTRAFVHERLEETLALVDEPARLAARSYVVTATDFRRGLAVRASDPILSTKVRLASLPKFVWVVEIMNRKRREAIEPSVLGEVVLDASNVDRREMNALITHLPGLVQVGGRQRSGSLHVLSSTEMYRSGRYHGDKDWMNDPVSTVSRWKYSI